MIIPNDRADQKNEKGPRPSGQQEYADSPPPYIPPGGLQPEAGSWPDEKKSRDGYPSQPGSPPHGDSKSAEAGFWPDQASRGGYQPPSGPPPPPGPSYQQQGGFSQQPHPATIPRTNYVNVDSPNSSVRGTWYIDPSLQIHQSLLGPMPAGMTSRPHAKIYSKNGGVNAEIYILGETRERVYMDIGSKNGSVTVKVPERAGHPFYLNAYSHNGSVTVYLPANFIGALKHTTHNGKVTFSSELQGRLARFGDVGGVGQSFLGDWASAGYGTDDGRGGMREWHGDEVLAESKNGSINFRLATEASAGGGGHGGLGGSGSGGFGGFLKKFTS